MIVISWKWVFAKLWLLLPSSRYVMTCLCIVGFVINIIPPDCLKIGFVIIFTKICEYMFVPMSFFLLPYQNNNMFHPCEFYLVIVPSRSVIYFLYGFVKCLCLVSSCYCPESDDMFTHYGSPLLPSIYYLVIFGYQLISFYLTSIWVGFAIKVNWVMCGCFVHKLIFN